MPPDTSAADERPKETLSSAYPADHAAARKFLEFIFSDSAGGFIEFRYFTAGRRPKVTGKSSYYHLPLNYDEALGEVLTRNGQQMITVGLAPRCRVPPKGGVAKSQDVLQVNCLWANLDNRRARGGALEVIKRIHEFPLRPSVTVNSGYGYHLYFVFREPFGGSLLLEWGELMRGLGDALHSPDKIDISQVMRLPGTLNVKEEHLVPCEVVEEYSAWARYGITEVKSAIEEAAARAQPSTAPARRARVDHDDDLNFADDDLPPGYYREDDGSIWFSPPAEEGVRKTTKPVKVSNSPVYISRIQENIDTDQVSLTLSFDYLGRKRSATILRSQMSDSRQLNAALSGGGAPVTSINARHVMAYLAAYEHTFSSTIPIKKVTSRFGRGRSGGQFFLPGLSSEVDFAPAGPGDASLFRAYSSRRGELRVWSALMRELWREQLMIPQVAVLAALIPPLQRKLQIPNFILDIYGGTSTGKSTALKIAASVYGNPHDPDSLVMQWTNTTAAVEQVAAMCSELPIFLDDAQHCPAELKRSLIYMIANGRGKGRGGSRGGISETATWHTVALSTSEEPLYEASPHEGARGRILSVGGHVPPFLPGMPGMVLNMERGAALYHGKAGETYIRHLNDWPEVEWVMWQKRYGAIRTELVRDCSSDLVGRVSGYISAIQLAAEIACPALELEFKPDVVSAWLMLHLEEQQSEQNQVLAALRALADYYVSNINHFAGDGHYLTERRLAIYGASKRQQYVGFLRSTVESVFKSRKWNPTALLNKLAEAGALCATEKDRHTKKVSLGGVTHRMVCVKWSAILPGDANEESSQ
jgi:Domain of unknown function (DUF927)